MLIMMMMIMMMYKSAILLADLCGVETFTF